ncbi:MAG TPA: hypothetical protein PLH61_01900 [Bacteroidia bacterium]|jgi:hypothetical protein|nr:hypothetical protein [Bacteroidia bacterium]HQK96742.1 hypothetical protein [Bacteroidia bacterium]
MKKQSLLLTFALVICVLFAKATVITVSNSPISGGQYTSAQTAINAASVDDTVYLHGTGISYGNFTISKRITLIGAGYSPVGTQFVQPTIAGTITLDTVAFTFPVSGLHIIGIEASSFTISNPINNVHIERCAGSFSYVRGDGWIIEHCLISSLYSYSTPTFSSRIIRNNIIYGNSGIGFSSVTNGSGLLIDHNIIQGTISYLQYAVITNNVFTFSGIANSTANSFNTYNNNITVNTVPDAIPLTNNSGSGNINNANPSTVFIGNVTSYQSYPSLLNVNWHLTATSPGHNAATDGTDIGIYGGVNPMPNLTGASTLPQMTELNIQNPSLPVNGTLNYQFKARKQN